MCNAMMQQTAKGELVACFLSAGYLLTCSMWFMTRASHAPRQSQYFTCFRQHVYAYFCGSSNWARIHCLNVVTRHSLSSSKRKNNHSACDRHCVHFPFPEFNDKFHMDIVEVYPNQLAIQQSATNDELAVTRLELRSSGPEKYIIFMDFVTILGSSCVLVELFFGYV